LLPAGCWTIHSTDAPAVMPTMAGARGARNDEYRCDQQTTISVSSSDRVSPVPPEFVSARHC
jgi:hypothetical protein